VDTPLQVTVGALKSTAISSVGARCGITGHGGALRSIAVCIAEHCRVLQGIAGHSGTLHGAMGHCGAPRGEEGHEEHCCIQCGHCEARTSGCNSSTPRRVPRASVGL